MDINDYFYQKFPKELKKLNFAKPNKVVSEKIMNDASVMFFGGQNWKNANEDLSNISMNERPLFVLSLFLITLTDQCLFTYEPTLYEKWRNATNFPKFGWAGFGPHNENPFCILTEPEREGLVNQSMILDLMPEFVEFMSEQTELAFKESLKQVNLKDYFNYIINDKAYSLDEGEILKSFKLHFEGKYKSL